MTTSASTLICSCGAIPRAAASRSVAEPASNRQPHSSAAPSSGRFERSSCGAPARTSTSAGPRACHASGIEKSRRSAEPGGGPSRYRRARTRPAATSSGTVAGGSSTSIGTSTSCDGHDVAGADRELDARDERVEHDERDGDDRRRSRRRRPARAAARRRRAGTARRRRARSASSRRSTPRERVSHDSSRRRSAASSLRMSSTVVSVNAVIGRSAARQRPGGPSSSSGHRVAVIRGA